MKITILLIITTLCVGLTTNLFAQYPAELIEYHTEISLKKNKLKTKVTKRLQINSSAADDYTNTYLHFSKGDNLKIHTVRIEDVNGKTIRELKKKEIKTQSSVMQGALYTDDFVKYFKPKWHQYPYRIYFEYTHIVDDFLSLARWSPVTQAEVSTREATLSITLPNDYPINISNLDSIDFTQNKTSDETSYTWTAKNVLPPKIEKNAPPLRSILPTVMVFPVAFTYGLDGSQQTWQDYGKWQYQMNEDLRELPASEKQKIEELIAGLTTPKDIVHKLYNYLQENHRYILVAIETGGLQPYPASYVCEKRYGDCKALTNFMQAMLEYVNIPAFYVKVYAGDNPIPLKTDIPGQQFNHVILGVPLNGDTLWLENTSNSNPPGYLGTFTQNRKGLLVHSADSRLIDLPKLTAEKPVHQSTFNFILDEMGKGSLTIQTTVTNQDFEILNFYQKNRTPIKIKKLIQQYFPLTNASLLNYTFSQPDALRPALDLQTKWTAKRQYLKIANKKVVSPIPFKDIELEKIDKRTQSVVFNYPENESFEVNYKIANLENYKVELPEPINVSTPYGTLSMKATVTDGKIKIQQHRTINSGTFLLETYPELYAFCKMTNDISKKFQIVCSPK